MPDKERVRCALVEGKCGSCGVLLDGKSLRKCTDCLRANALWQRRKRRKLSTRPILPCIQCYSITHEDFECPMIS